MSEKTVRKNESYGEFEHAHKYTSAMMHLERQLDPKRTELQEIVESQYYVPRRIDIERICAIASSGAQKEKQGIRILDLGGGRGFLAKLIADRAGAESAKSLIVDLDIKQNLGEAATFYKDTRNLSFVRGDVEKGADSMFSIPFDVVIVSWAYKDVVKNRNEVDYSRTVKNLSPRFFINIGHEDREITGVFDAGKEYEKIGEWFGPVTLEITGGEPTHWYGEERNEKLKKTGSNLFEIYVRKDIPPEDIDTLKEKLMQLDSHKLPPYRWEKELAALYPEPAHINFDKTSFWRNEKTG